MPVLNHENDLSCSPTCLHSIFVTQFARFKTGRILDHFNQKHVLNFTAVATMELTYADMYTDQSCSHIAHGNGNRQLQLLVLRLVQVIKTQHRHWENDLFKEWCKRGTRRCGFLSGANCFNIWYFLPSIRLPKMKKKKKNKYLSNPPCFVHF